MTRPTQSLDKRLLRHSGALRFNNYGTTAQTDLQVQQAEANERARDHVFYSPKLKQRGEARNPRTIIQRREETTRRKRRLNHLDAERGPSLRAQVAWLGGTSGSVSVSLAWKMYNAPVEHSLTRANHVSASAESPDTFPRAAIMVIGDEILAGPLHPWDLGASGQPARGVRILTTAERFTGGSYVSHVLYTHLGEGDLAKALTDIAKAHPKVNIGSYPNVDELDSRFKVKLQVTSRDPIAVHEAIKAIQEGITGQLLGCYIHLAGAELVAGLPTQVARSS
eukprot:gene6692-3361_t